MIVQQGAIRGGILLLVFFAVCVFVGLFIATRTQSTCPAHITIADTILCVLVAESDAEIQRGLGGRDELRDYDGMIFMFRRDGEYAFWMKDMRFGLDIVWIRADGTIVGIEHNVRPESYPTTVTPPEPVRMVLEVASGAASEEWVGKTIQLRAE